jgi:hypothetical protein
MAKYYQIGTSEPHDCVGSRAAKSETLEGALRECRQYSVARHVKEAWLRPVEDGRMGDVIATFVKGNEVQS